MLIIVSKLHSGTSFSKVHKFGAQTSYLNVLATNLVKRGLQWYSPIANGGHENVTIS